MSDLGDTSSLLVAGLDLSLVRMLRDAMRTADLSVARSASPAPQNSTAPDSPAAVTQGPVIGVVNQAIQQSHKFADQPAATFHRSEPPIRCCRLGYTCCEKPVEPVHLESPVQPPWKVLPWPQSPQPRKVRQFVKILPNRTDVTPAGRTLDLFV